MALTLVEAAKLNSGDVLRSTVIEMFARRSPILAALPFETIPGGSVKYNREGALPGVAFRGINEAYTESVGAINPVVDSTFIAGGDVDVDRYIVQTMGMEQRSVQEQLKIKALADTWAVKFVKGDNTSDPREFDGLQARLVGNQLVAAGSTANGDALSLVKLDAAIDAVDNPTALIMSKAMRRKFSAAARSTSVAGYITWTKGEFGQSVLSYNDLPILYTENGATEPLGFTEACPGGGTSTGTSIYVVSFGPGKLVGIQNGVMDVRDLGEQQDKPVFRTRIEWYAGIALYHGRAACRLWGISDAAIVA